MIKLLPAHPKVRTLLTPPTASAQSLVKKLKSHKLHNMAKTKKCKRAHIKDFIELIKISERTSKILQLVPRRT